MKSQDNDGLWADSPIESGAQDSFDRLKLAESTARLLSSSAKGESSVVAYIGPWGCGKTSLINMTINELERTGGENGKMTWKIVHFSPWATGGIEGMLGEFYAALQPASPKKRGKNFKKSLAQVIEIATPVMTASTSLTGLSVFNTSINTGASFLSKILKRSKPWNVAFKEINDIFKKLDYKILVVADDIDRLQESELRAFFKIIKLIGDLPNVFYLIAYDNDAIVGTLSGNFSENYSERQINKYIEKFVQFPVNIPQISDFAMANFIIDEIRRCIPKDFDTLNNIFCENISVFLDYLDTPRSVARFINQFKMYVSHYSGDDINYSELLVILLIKLHIPDLYNEIYRNKINLTSLAVQIGVTHPTPIPKELSFFAEFMESVEPNNKVQREKVKMLVSSLFPFSYGACLTTTKNVEDKLTRTLALQTSEKQHNMNVSISNRWSFQRYFDFSVDSYDISESSIMKAIEKSNGEGFLEIYFLINGVDIRLNDLLFPKLKSIINSLIIQNNIEKDVFSFIIFLTLRRLRRIDSSALPGIDRQNAAREVLEMIWDFIDNMDMTKYNGEDIENIFNLKDEIHFATQFFIVYRLYHSSGAKFSHIKNDIEKFWILYKDRAVIKLDNYICQCGDADLHFPFLKILRYVAESEEGRKLVSKKFLDSYLKRKFAPDDYISRFMNIEYGYIGTFDKELYCRVTSFSISDQELGYGNYFDENDDCVYSELLTWENLACRAKQNLRQYCDCVVKD